MPRKFELTPEQRAADARRAHICAIVTTVLSALVFVLVVVGTPLDQFKAHVGTTCYSYFGRKECGKAKLVGGLPMKGFPCKEVNQMMTCGAAMSIITILTSLCATIVYGCYAGGVNPRVTRVVALVFATCTFSFLLIAWAMAVQSRDTTCENSDGDYRLKTDYKLDAGFGLHVTAWCLQGITFLFILLSWGE